MNKEAINKWVLVLLVFFILALYLSMIRQVLMAIFLTGIFSALSHPLYRRFERWFRGRRGLASLVTLVLIVRVVLLRWGACWETSQSRRLRSVKPSSHGWKSSLPSPTPFPMR